MLCEICGKDTKKAGHIMTECLASHRGRQKGYLSNQVKQIDSLSREVKVAEIPEPPYQIRLSDFRKLSVVKIKSMLSFQIVADGEVILDCRVVEPRVGGGVVVRMKWGKTEHGEG